MEIKPPGFHPILNNRLIVNKTRKALDFKKEGFYFEAIYFFNSGPKL
jgi:hypothetical protein